MYEFIHIPSRVTRYLSYEDVQISIYLFTTILVLVVTAISSDKAVEDLEVVVPIVGHLVQWIIEVEV